MLLFCFLQLDALQAAARLVEVDLLARVQALLEGAADLNSLDGATQLEGQLVVIKAGGSKLVGLGDEGVLKAAVVIVGDLTADTSELVQLNESTGGVGVDSQLAVGTDDLSHIVLASSHHTRRVEVGDLATPELNNAHTVVNIFVLAQLRLYGGDTSSDDALDDGVLAEEPQGKIDIVDVAVDEDATAKLGVCDEEAGGVKLITSLGAEDGRAPNATVIHAVEGVPVRGVEAAGEAAHDLQVRLLDGGVDDRLRL